MKWLVCLSLLGCSAQTELARTCDEMARAPQLYQVEEVRKSLGPPVAEQVKRLEAWTWPRYCVATVDLDALKIVAIEADGAPPSDCWTLEDELNEKGTLEVFRAVSVLGGEPLTRGTIESTRHWVYVDDEIDGFICRIRFDYASGVARSAAYTRRPDRVAGYFE